jgi:uncharacterized protein (TIGR00369 family)
MDYQNVFDQLADMYENQMPFDRLLGVQVETLSFAETRVRIDMKDEFIGNYFRKILHGGVISSVLDLTGGLIASVELIKNIASGQPELIMERLTRIGTIDLRVDFLEAGKGAFFMASGSVLRKGNKVAVIRTEMHNDQKLLIAAGTGTYLVG